MAPWKIVVGRLAFPIVATCNFSGACAAPCYGRVTTTMFLATQKFPRGHLGPKWYAFSESSCIWASCPWGPAGWRQAGWGRFGRRVCFEGIPKKPGRRLAFSDPKKYPKKQRGILDRCFQKFQREFLDQLLGNEDVQDRWETLNVGTNCFLPSRFGTRLFVAWNLYVLSKWRKHVTSHEVSLQVFTIKSAGYW